MSDRIPLIGEVFRTGQYSRGLRLVATIGRIHNGLGCLCWCIDYNGRLEEKYDWAMEPYVVEVDTYE